MPLLAALALGLLFQVHPGDAITGRDPGAAAALAAARSGDIVGLNNALDQGVDINFAEAGSGQTLLMAATLAGAEGTVDLLLGRGADASIGEKQGYTPPHGAGFQGRAAVVLTLARHGINLDDMHEDGFTGMHRALWGAEQRHTDTVAAFLDAGVDVNQRARDGRHPLKITKNTGTRALLRERGADEAAAPQPPRQWGRQREPLSEPINAEQESGAVSAGRSDEL